jgi:hypothetical protein
MGWRWQSRKTAGLQQPLRSQKAKARETFFEKCKLVNRDLYPDGGSPSSDELRKEASEAGLETVKGKKLLAALKGIDKAAGRQATGHPPHLTQP